MVDSRPVPSIGLYSSFRDELKLSWNAAKGSGHTKVSQSPSIAMPELEDTSEDGIGQQIHAHGAKVVTANEEHEGEDDEKETDGDDNRQGEKDNEADADDDAEDDEDGNDGETNDNGDGNDDEEDEEGEGDDDDGDDDEEDDDEDDDDDDDEEEEEEEEEEEPRLKYQRLGGSVPEILKRDICSTLCVDDKFIAIGTHEGDVRVLDILGNAIKLFVNHSTTVNEIAFDDYGEYIGSCSDDGTVVICSLYTDEKLTYAGGRPLNALALDPMYAKKTSKQFITGGKAGTLNRYRKKWMGKRDEVIHSGEGTVSAISWNGNLIVWANERGVRAINSETDEFVAFLDRPKYAASSDMYRPSLVWENESTLIIGWGNFVKIVRIDPASTAVVKSEVEALFQTDDYFVAGIAPYRDPDLPRSLVVLCYREQEDGEPDKPEVRIMSWAAEEICRDGLAMHGCKHYRVNDYRLALSECSGEALWYIVSPMDMIMAKRRDQDDHVLWLLENERYEQALSLVGINTPKTLDDNIRPENKRLVSSKVFGEVTGKYLRHLCDNGRFKEAAKMCPLILQNNISGWERWIYTFLELRQLRTIASFVPTHSPRLQRSTYIMILDSFLSEPEDHDILGDIIKAWPPEVYDLETFTASVLKEIEAVAESSKQSSKQSPKQSSKQSPKRAQSKLPAPLLQEVLAELYFASGKTEEALGIHLQLQHPYAFEFIAKNNLMGPVRDKVEYLMKMDTKRAIRLLIDHIEEISPQSVYDQIQAVEPAETSRSFTHQYLHSLFEYNPEIGSQFHTLQVELYAEFNPSYLGAFLENSQYYSLEDALSVCQRLGFVKETVFIYQRMGNNKRALELIIEELRDVGRAIDHILSQRADDLWDDLIESCLKSPPLLGDLLEQLGGHINPLTLLQRIPLQMPIPRLPERLVKILSDYRTQESLRMGCNEIVKSDCLLLFARLMREAQTSLRVRILEDDATMASSPGRGRSSATASSSSSGNTVAKRSIAGSGRCCSCLEHLNRPSPGRQLSAHSPSAASPPTAGPATESVIFCFCNHAYHLSCLKAAKEAITSNMRGAPLADGPEANPSNYQHHQDQQGFICILCTAAEQLVRKRSSYHQQPQQPQQQHYSPVPLPANERSDAATSDWRLPARSRRR